MREINDIASEGVVLMKIMFNEFTLKIRNTVIEIKTISDRHDLLAYKIDNNQFTIEEASEYRKLEIQLKKLKQGAFNRFHNCKTNRFQLCSQMFFNIE